MNKKVYILTILVFVMAINAVFSQTTTKKLSYQAVVRNAANELVVNQNLSVEITILNANNVPQYKETHATVPTNQNGLLWLWVGDGTPTLGTMDNVVWKDATIKSVFTLPDGSTVEQNTPVTAMPYAYFADEVDTIFLQDYLTTHNYGNDDYVTHQELNDTLNHYYTNEQVDAALIPYATNAHLNDTLSHYLMKEVQVLSISHDTIFLTGGSFVVLPKGFSGSYHDLVDTPTNVSAFTNDAGYLTEHQSLEGYVTTTQMNNQHYLTSDSTVITTMQTNITNLQNGIKKNALCDSVNDCVHGWISDSTRMVIDSLNAYYDTTHMKTAIHDTANVLRDLMGDAANNATITIKKNNVEVDHFTLNQENDKAIDITVPTTVAELSDASNYVTNTKLSDTLNKYTTTNKVDTLLGAYYDTSYVNQTFKQYLITGDLCDSIVKCQVIKDMRDSIKNAFDTLAIFFDSTKVKSAIHDTANAIRNLIPPAAKEGNITIEVVNGTVQSGEFNVNQAENQTVTITIPEVQEVYNGQLTLIQKGDTTRFKANQALNDTVDFSGYAKSDTLKAYYDTTQVKKAIHDSIGNGTLTIKRNNEAVGTFTANQKTDQTLNIEVPAAQVNADWDATEGVAVILHKPTIPTTVAQLTDANDYAKKTADNTFTGANNFTEGSITVPSKFDIQNPPTATTCTQDAVNVCDLLAVLESLNNKIQALEDALEDAQEEIEEMKNTMPTLTVTADNPDINITAEENVPITYTASVLRSSADFSYRWYVNGVLQEGVTGNSLPYTHNASGSYKVECIATAPGPIELKGSLKKTICIANRPLALEYSFISGDSADFGKIRILGSTASSAIWYNEDNKEVGRWNSGLTDVLPRGVYTVALSSSACERKDTITIALIASPLCLAGHLFEDYEDGVTILGRKYVTRVKDIDNNWYNVVEIGIGNYVNCWTRENMRATRYINNNDTLNITNGTELEESVSVSEPYFFNLTGINPNLGYLYNWPAASGKDVANGNTAYSYYTRGICPEGWHLPSLWNAIVMLDESITNANNNAGMLVGSLPIETWTECCENTSAPGNYSYKYRNITGFSAIQSGYWDDSNVPSERHSGQGAYFWTSRTDGGASSFCFKINNNLNTVAYGNYDKLAKAYGASIRCVRNDVELDPSLSLSSSENGAVSMCDKESVTVTYTATIDNDYPEDYSFTWSVTPTPLALTESDNSCTLTYNSTGNYTVLCSATRNDNEITRNAVFTTEVYCELAPNITLCDHNLTVTVSSATGDPNSINWGDETSTTNSITPYQTYHNYSTPGNYNIVVSNDSYSKTIPVTVTKPHTTCTVSTILDNEAGSGSVIDSVKDHQNNWYEVVQIGNQCWLKENMRATTSPKSGNSIVGSSNSPILSFTSKVAYWYNNNSAFYAPKNYGLLYNWCAAMDTCKPGSFEVATANAIGDSDTWHFEFSGHHRGICPAGWHVPTNDEWNTMESEVNGSPITTVGNDWNRGSHAGKLSASCDWADTSSFGVEPKSPGYYGSDDRNSSGFSALPAGGWNPSGFYDAATPNEYGLQATFWTSSNNWNDPHVSCSDITGVERVLVWRVPTVMFYNYNKSYGMSVRCVRDTQ